MKILCTTLSSDDANEVSINFLVQIESYGPDNYYTQLNINNLLFIFSIIYIVLPEIEMTDQYFGQDVPTFSKGDVCPKLQLFFFKT